jgi:hypothetical protein
VLEAVGERRSRQAPIGEPQQHPRIDAARARGHHEALERGEAHRGVDRPPGGDRAQRGAGTEVGADEPQIPALGADQLTGTAGDVGVRETVEAEASQRPAFTPGGRQSVGRGAVGDGRVERGVKAGDARHAGESETDGIERGERTRLVKRRQLAQLAQLRFDAAIDADRRAEALPAVNDPVTDGVGSRQRAERVSEQSLIRRFIGGRQLALAKRLVSRADQ